MKEFIRENKDNIIILCVSIVAFIFGCLSIGPLLSILIIGLCDIVLFIPNLIKKYKKGESMERKKKPKKTVKHESKHGKKKTWKKVLKVCIIIFFVLCVLAFIGLGLFVHYIVSHAPTFNPENLYKQESSVFYDINGEVYATLGSEKRENVTYDELPEVLINAIVATEDSRFFQHSGVDWARFLKATFLQLLGKEDAGGASTITMQVSKNDVTQDTTSTGIKGIIRKFTDVYMSLEQIEKKYTKEEIMEFYVNSYYLGGGASGVEQACQTYFGKSVSEINLAEASIIAGLFQLPGAYDPLVYPEKTEVRRKTVLNLMVRHGYITEEERDAALAIPVEDLLVDDSDSSNDQEKNLSFINTVVEQLIEEFGEEKGNPYTNSMEVWTTMDPDKQDYINDIMSGETWNWENDEVTAGIAVVDTKTGAISAVGGGRNVVKRGFNTATKTKKQIGSTSKPLYDYAPGIEYENWSTYEPFTDEKYSYSNGKELNNWDVKYEGFLTARTALAHSRNVSALKAFQANKNSNIKKFVTGLGLHPEVEGGSIHEAHSIGGYTGESPLSMAAAYAAFANGGYYIEPYSYTKVTFRQNNETVEKQINKTKAMGEDTAYMVYDMLTSSAKYGLGNQSNINGATYGAKTGTSNFDDATKKAKGLPSNAINDYWVTGVSPDYAISVWYGYTKVYQRLDPSKDDYCKNCYNTINEIYHRKLFQAVAKGFFKKESKLSMPNSVVKVEVENETYPAMLPSEYTPDDMKVTELFKKGTEPTQVSTRYSKLDNVSNLTGSISNNQLTLTWTGIKTPSSIDEASLKTFFSSFWKDTNIPLKARKEYNSKYIGNVTYKVYSVGDDGSLSLVDTTTENSITFSVNSASSDTYIVKTSYSIFTANMSDGAKVTINMNGVTSEVTAELIGTNPYVWTGSYTESGVRVTENNIDVTDKATITIEYTNSNNEKITVADLVTSGTYTATYTVTYNTFTQTLTRTIVIP